MEEYSFVNLISYIEFIHSSIKITKFCAVNQHYVANISDVGDNFLTECNDASTVEYRQRASNIANWFCQWENAIFAESQWILC